MTRRPSPFTVAALFISSLALASSLAGPSEGQPPAQTAGRFLMRTAGNQYIIVTDSETGRSWSHSIGGGDK